VAKEAGPNALSEFGTAMTDATAITDATDATDATGYTDESSVLPPPNEPAPGDGTQHAALCTAAPLCGRLFA
jgi:hypothetical protein